MNPKIAARLNERLRRAGCAFTVPCSLPVLYFGDLINARIATVGLNPSWQEYLGPDGRELDGQQRRFETLTSLNAADRAALTNNQCNRAVETMRGYFGATKPVYPLFFSSLGRVVEGLGFSFRAGTAAHLDLVQESTCPVWSEIVKSDKRKAAALLATDLPFLRWQIEAFAFRAVVCTSRTVLDEVVKFTAADARDKGEFLGRLWTVAIASISGRSIAVTGWNRPLARAPGMTCEQQIELGRLLRERVNATGVSL